jgi:hypothetical protein
MTLQRAGMRAVARPVVHAIRRGRRTYDRLRWERGLEDLEEWVHPDGLDANPERTRYEASSYDALQRALRGEKIGPEHVFIDYGSGKGRVVLQAARRPFGRVMGLEVDKELCSVARRNAAKVAHRLKAGSVETVCADALEWVPPDDITHAYFFNPFSGDVFRAAVDGLIASYDRRPRTLKLLYLNPTMEPILLAAGRVRRTRVSRGLRPDLLSHRLCVYEVEPPR